MRLSVSYIWFLLGLRLSRRWFHRKETICAVTLAIFVASAYKTLVQYVRVGVPASWLRVRTPGFAIHAPESARRIAARNSSSLNGLMKNATGPIAIAVARAARSSRAVTTMTRGRGESAHIRARISRPVTPSIQISVTTTDTECVAAWARNSSGLLNARTFKPSDASKYSIERRTDRSSSTRQTSLDSTASLMQPGFVVPCARGGDG